MKKELKRFGNYLGLNAENSDLQYLLLPTILWGVICYQLFNPTDNSYFTNIKIAFGIIISLLFSILFQIISVSNFKDNWKEKVIEIRDWENHDMLLNYNDLRKYKVILALIPLLIFSTWTFTFIDSKEFSKLQYAVSWIFIFSFLNFIVTIAHSIIVKDIKPKTKEMYFNSTFVGRSFEINNFISSQKRQISEIEKKLVSRITDLSKFKEQAYKESEINLIDDKIAQCSLAEKDLKNTYDKLNSEVCNYFYKELFELENVTKEKKGVGIDFGYSRRPEHVFSRYFYDLNQQTCDKWKFNNNIEKFEKMKKNNEFEIRSYILELV